MDQLKLDFEIFSAASIKQFVGDTVAKQFKFLSAYFKTAITLVLASYRVLLYTFFF